ncbi:putative endonuclease lcl3 [Golovinomyces cichoracearum]|uniref:Probable endonuclease LCL3 n=1 Tax=Golovinomyces cichoracearum TaxID=62708 RepID=A0A420IND7_9PEZI|nr:putative endonuclease lcl3 [Golovinomyces cichoracearum]
MPWPPWSGKNDDTNARSVSWPEHIVTTACGHYIDPSIIIPTTFLTTIILLSARIHRSYLRRIPEAKYIKPKFFRKRSLFGKVTRVGDADNFHLFHTPGGRLTGWGWLPGRKVPDKKANLKGKTIHIRLAGIDAPELAHWGKPGQPYSAEALAWLESYIYNRRVRAYIYKRDQYERIVATVWVRRFLFRRDVGKEMLKAGWATVYEAKSGAEFGDYEEDYRKAEMMAKRKKVGMWARKSKAFESPRDYKTRTATMKNT